MAIPRIAPLEPPIHSWLRPSHHTTPVAHTMPMRRPSTVLFGLIARASGRRPKTRPPSATSAMATGIARTATRRRPPRSEPRRARAGRGRDDGGRTPSAPPEAADARGELVEGLAEGLAREVRPQLVAEDELRVGRLP